MPAVIVEYLRPKTIEETLKLLARQDPPSLPLAGGTRFKQQAEGSVAAVDLQMLGLTEITPRGNQLSLGASATLQSLLDFPDLPPALKKAVRHEASYNLRQVGTVAGTLVSAGGRSPFAAVMLALDASLALLPGKDRKVSLGEYFALGRDAFMGSLITEVQIPLNVRLAYEYVARTPADQPLVCAASCIWGSGRTRLVLGGYGKAPVLAMDGPEPSGAEEAARDAYAAAGDEWASAEYRREIAGILARRALSR